MTLTLTPIMPWRWACWAASSWRMWAACIGFICASCCCCMLLSDCWYCAASWAWILGFIICPARCCCWARSCCWIIICWRAASCCCSMLACTLPGTMPLCCSCCWYCWIRRCWAAICWAAARLLMLTFGICAIPWLFMSMACPICCGVGVMTPAGGLACVMRGVGTTWGRVIGVAWGMLGVAEGTRGVPAAWLCWLPRADIDGAMGTPMGWF